MIFHKNYQYQMEDLVHPKGVPNHLLLPLCSRLVHKKSKKKGGGHGYPESLDIESMVRYTPFFTKLGVVVCAACVTGGVLKVGFDTPWGCTESYLWY